MTHLSQSPFFFKCRLKMTFEPCNKVPPEQLFLLLLLAEHASGGRANECLHYASACLLSAIAATCQSLCTLATRVTGCNQTQL